MNRTALKAQLLKDGIDYLLVQFVDIHGPPRSRWCRPRALDDVADSGAGFAGGAVWGMGQNATSHDMMARIDLDHLHAAFLEARPRPFRRRPVRRR